MRLAAAAVIGSAAVMLSPIAPAPVVGASADARQVTLGGVTVELATGTRQVITVNQTTGWHATVSLWRKRDSGWERRLTAYDGRIGYGGLVPGDEREQGTGTTPLGTYTLTESFGNRRRPEGAALPFHRVRPGDYWVQDNKSRFYNELRNKHQGGFRWWLPASHYNSSERLADYGRQYAWSVVVDFNRPDPVRHRGSGIFLHVNGDGATAGCVSTPGWFIRRVMSRLQPRLEPVIAIGR